MKHTIRYFILFFTLFIGSVGHAWAISESDIIINIQPNNSAGTVSVTGISAKPPAVLQVLPLSSTSQTMVTIPSPLPFLLGMMALM